MLVTVEWFSISVPKQYKDIAWNFIAVKTFRLNIDYYIGFNGKTLQTPKEHVDDLKRDWQMYLETKTQYIYLQRGIDVSDKL